MMEVVRKAKLGECADVVERDLWTTLAWAGNVGNRALRSLAMSHLGRLLGFTSFFLHGNRYGSALRDWQVTRILDLDFE